MKRALDLFCGAGGASMGLHRAGYEVTGVDIKPQPNYPFFFVQADALQVDWAGFDLVWASPPCQAFTQMSAKYRGKGGKTDSHFDLLTPMLALLRNKEFPWVVENVPGARKIMRPTITLHGGMFDLGVHRPRLFESNCMLLGFKAPQAREPVGVYGNRPDGRTLWRRYRNNVNWRTAKNPRKSLLRAPRSLEEAQAAMGIDWMEWHELKESIPPAYSEFIGKQLIGMT